MIEADGAQLASDAEFNSKLAELDRLLNDPDVPMQPGRVWSLVDELTEDTRRH